MGYTHYWRQQRDFTEAEWSELKDTFEKLQKVSNVKLSNGMGGEGTKPEVTNEKIWFNGVEDDAHETCGFDKIMKSDFEFCKTAEKPYDSVVVAMLISIDKIAPGAMVISSDGDMNGDDWQPGRRLFNETR